MKKIFCYPLAILTLFVISMTSCWDGDRQAKREMLFENQPSAAYVDNYIATIQFDSPIAVDPLTVRVQDAAGKTIFVRCTDKAKLTDILNLALDGKIHGYEVWGNVRPTSYHTKYLGKKIYVWEVVGDVWTTEDKDYHMVADSVRGYNLRDIEKNSREKSKVRTILAPLPSRTTVTKPCDGSVEFTSTSSDGTKIEFRSVQGVQQPKPLPNTPTADSIPRPGATVPVPQ